MRTVAEITGRERQPVPVYGQPYALVRSAPIGPGYPVRVRSGHVVDIAPAGPMFAPWSEPCRSCGGELETGPACTTCNGFGRSVVAFVIDDPTRYGHLPIDDIPPGQLARLMALPDELA